MPTTLFRSSRRQEAEARKPPRSPWGLPRPLMALCLLLCSVEPRAILAATIDISKLPPAATNLVEFLRDIQPILDAHCLKCHGPEKPKSGFRLDTRANALKGGENAPDVIPKNSAQSPLIHFVAGLVEDMEMPPRGKGEALTAQEIALLRAWIDQDLPWSGTVLEPALVMEAAPTVGWTTVRGDERKFRELEWRREGWNGGAESVFLRERLSDDGRKLIVTGHALRDDYKLTLDLENPGSVSVRMGVQQYRKYYDDSGGLLPSLALPLSRLGQDLHLDLGDFFIEAGGITPFGLQLTGGYEFHSKEGDKSISQWIPTITAAGPKAILPNAKQVEERLHVLRLDAAYDWRQARLLDAFRYEFYNLDTRRPFVQAGFPLAVSNQQMTEGSEARTLVNAFRTEFQPREWMLLCVGYLFTHTTGEDSFRQTSTDATTGAPAIGLLWNGRGITLEQSAHVFNANAQLGMWEGMTFSSGLQTEWNRHRSFGLVNLDASYADPAEITGNTNILKGDYDVYTVEEKFLLRNIQIPYTVLFGEARFRQERIDQVEELGPGGAGLSTLSDFLRDTEARYDWKHFRAGFTTSPWTRLALSAYVQRRDHDDTFQHLVDQRPLGNPGLGYPAFITARETTADEVGAKLALRPAHWLKTTLSVRAASTDFETTTESTPALLGQASTPGGRVLAGQYNAHVYSFNTTLTPWRRLYLFSTFSAQDSRTVTETHGTPAIVPFHGHVYSVLTSGHYVLDERTDLNLAYDFTYAEYGQHNDPAGLPLGIDFRRHDIRAGIGRKFWRRFLANVEYVCSLYDEPTSGHFHDFTAHGVFATLHLRWD